MSKLKGLSFGVKGKWQSYRSKSFNENAPSGTYPEYSGAAEDAPAQNHDLPEYSRATEQALFNIHPDWINIADIRHWADTCNSEHGAKCGPRPGLTGRPEWLIDVEADCIVPAQPDHRYLALSYVWGQVYSSESTTRNVGRMQRPGSLSALSQEFVIPKTIRHAMELVRLLSERYIWVDRFCICQDDAQSKRDQIRKMGAIYSNAYVTIIAANGRDANHGLHGIDGVTAPRCISSTFDQDYVHSLQSHSTRWHDRGWTFQELFFSRRKIFFWSQVAVWECNCAMWHEGTGLTGKLPTSNYDIKRSSQNLAMSLVPWGQPIIERELDLEQYFHWSWVSWEGPVSSMSVTSKSRAYPDPPPCESFEVLCEWKWPCDREVLKQTTGSDVRQLSENREELGQPVPNDGFSHLLQIETETATFSLQGKTYWFDGADLNSRDLLGPSCSRIDDFHVGGWFFDEPERFELMLIARSTQAPGRRYYYQRDSNLSPSWTEETLCNLLIFQRRNGIAYRLGVLIMPQEWWIHANRKKETIFLA
ncbi:hypothetical protein AK830_g5101 [Neonectria ditissima]|uniref:Heterokaryon incompatibility domain-containing protein n=1 Tax=Neonectria ditissima TaxID=78410 RepID=A0A0P7BLP9_9HYPO|nr:hypothetical protein AK830_g5101 [Neonectria ditissima]